MFFSFSDGNLFLWFLSFSGFIVALTEKSKISVFEPNPVDLDLGYLNLDGSNPDGGTSVFLMI